jgi:hypothetical protein
MTRIQSLLGMSGGKIDEMPITVGEAAAHRPKMEKGGERKRKENG